MRIRIEAHVGEGIRLPINYNPLLVGSFATSLPNQMSNMPPFSTSNRTRLGLKQVLAEKGPTVARADV